MLAPPKDANDAAERRIVVNASELAAFAGMHRYVPAHVAMASVWRKTDPVSFRLANERVGACSQSRAAGTCDGGFVVDDEERLGSMSTQAIAAVEAAVVAPSEGGADAEAVRILQLPLIRVDDQTVVAVQHALASGRDPSSAAMRVLRSIDRAVADRVVASLRVLGTEATACGVATVLGEPRIAHCAGTAAAVRGAVNTGRGTRFEGDAVALYEKATGRTVSNRNDRVYCGDVVSSTACPCEVRGCVDGLADDRVVEVKCRRNNFFAFVPQYEKVQMHAYMFLTRRALCDWVQKLDRDVRVGTVEFEPTFWSTVCERVQAAAAALRELLANAAMQDDLVNMMRKPAVDTKRYS